MAPCDTFHHQRKRKNGGFDPSYSLFLLERGVDQLEVTARDSRRSRSQTHSRQMQKLMMLMRPDRSPLRGKPRRLNHQPRLRMMILGANGREEKAGKQLQQLKLQRKKMAAEFFLGRWVVKVVLFLGIWPLWKLHDVFHHHKMDVNFLAMNTEIVCNCHPG